MGAIRTYLKQIGAIGDDSIELFAPRTRDASVEVYRDRKSGVIFIDDFYVGEQEYISAEYRGKAPVPVEDFLDTERRARSHLPLIHNKSIVDFGFGDGSFLLQARKWASSVAGVELEARSLEFGRQNSVPVFTDLSEVKSPVDTVFAFHVVEHLLNPQEFLESARGCLAPSGGTLVIEVPHAKDFLLASLGVQEFKDFTLWSQHLVLHTRLSLLLMLESAGFEVVSVQGVQRYGLGNHLGWLSGGEPGRHKTPPFSAFESPILSHEYASVLSGLDANDTLVATARPLS